MGCSGNGRSDRRRDSRRWDSRLRCGHWKTTVDWVANAEAASPCGPAFRPYVSPRAKGGPSPGRLPNHGTAPFGTRESPRAKRFFRFVYHFGQNCPSWEKPFGILPGRFFIHRLKAQECASSPAFRYTNRKNRLARGDSAVGGHHRRREARRIGRPLWRLQRRALEPSPRKAGVSTRRRAGPTACSGRAFVEIQACFMPPFDQRAPSVRMRSICCTLAD